MNNKNRKDYARGGWQYVECALCGEKHRIYARSGAAAQRYVRAVKNDWWAKHTGQNSQENISAGKVPVCRKLRRQQDGLH